MSNRLRVLIPDELDTDIRGAASRQRLSEQEWVRRALRRALAEEPSARDPVAALAALDAPTADIDQMLLEIACGNPWLNRRV